MNTMQEGEKLQVTHINIRISISLLLLKLLFLEVIAAGIVIFLHSPLFFFEGQWLGEIGIRLFNIPLFIILVIGKIFLTIYIIFEWLDEYYEITSGVVYHRKGVLFKTEERYPLENMQRVEVSQSFFGRLLNYGTISLFDPRREKYEDLYLIHNPFRYSEIIEALMPKADVRKRIFREHIIEENMFDKPKRNNKRNMLKKKGGIIYGGT